MEGSEPNQWRYVPGTLNPADDASRGLHPHQLTSKHRWFKGSGFLAERTDKEFVPASDDPEARSHLTKYISPVARLGNDVPEAIYDRILERTNSMEHAIRILVWISRLLYRKRDERTIDQSLQDIAKDPLRLQEIKESEATFIRSPQKKLLRRRNRGHSNGQPEGIQSLPDRTIYGQ